MLFRSRSAYAHQVDRRYYEKDRRYHATTRRLRVAVGRLSVKGEWHDATPHHPHHVARLPFDFDNFVCAVKQIVASTDVGYYAAKVIFSRLNMNVTYDYWTDDARAIQKIVDGEADAYFGSTGKVFGLLRAVKNEDRRLHLVSTAGFRTCTCPRR